MRIDVRAKRLSDSGSVVEGQVGGEPALIIYDGLLLILDLLELCGCSVRAGCSDAVKRWRGEDCGPV